MEEHMFFVENIVDTHDKYVDTVKQRSNEKFLITVISYCDTVRYFISKFQNNGSVTDVPREAVHLAFCQEKPTQYFWYVVKPIKELIQVTNCLQGSKKEIKYNCEYNTSLTTKIVLYYQQRQSLGNRNNNIGAGWMLLH